MPLSQLESLILDIHTTYLSNCYQSVSVPYKKPWLDAHIHAQHSVHNESSLAEQLPDLPVPWHPNMNEIAIKIAKRNHCALVGYMLTILPVDQAIAKVLVDCQRASNQFAWLY